MRIRRRSGDNSEFRIQNSEFRIQDSGICALDLEIPVQRLINVLALATLLLLTACQSTANGVALVPVNDSPVVVRASNATITVADVEERFARDIGPAVADLLAQGQSPEAIEQLADQNNVRATIFDQMIQDVLLIDYARRNGIGINAGEIDVATFAQIPSLSEGRPFTSSTDIRESAARSQLVFEVIARNTRADMFRARHILVRDEATAESVLARLAAGEPFADLAAELSQDPGSAQQGGELGWTPRGDFVPEFEEAGFSIPLNTATAVASQFGVHVLEVLERAEQRSFDSFEALRRSQNAQLFFEESFAPWYDQLRAEAEASGELQISPGFDPNSVPLPFP
jgi:peptidyl-prolyl cis-trans isomerase C